MKSCESFAGLLCAEVKGVFRSETGNVEDGLPGFWVHVPSVCTMESTVVELSPSLLNPGKYQQNPCLLTFGFIK